MPTSKTVNYALCLNGKEGTYNFFYANHGLWNEMHKKLEEMGRTMALGLLWEAYWDENLPEEAKTLCKHILERNDLRVMDE